MRVLSSAWRSLVISALHTAIQNRRCEKAFPFDRNQRLVRVRMDRDVHFPLIPRYASLLWFTDRGFLMPGWPGPLWAATFRKKQTTR